MVTRNYIKVTIICFIHFLFYFSILSTYAQLPLITDNAELVGKKIKQVEACYGNEIDNTLRHINKNSYSDLIFTYGFNDKLDIVLGVPLAWHKIKSDTINHKEYGISDIGFEFKYQFLKNNKHLFVIKPGIIFPSGNYKNDFGCGEWNASLYFVYTLKNDKTIFNLNFGYLTNFNKCNSKMHIWDVCTSFDYELFKGFHPVLNFGIEKNPDKENNTPVIFGLIGLYYMIIKDIELSSGYKQGLSESECDYTGIAGFTIRF
ncbi:MAG: transporter [Bacteroidales bacterium]|jgi:hypothetical protein